jgi:hypothetical protein
LDDSSHTLVKANAAAIKISGVDEYSRILWNSASIFEDGSNVLTLSGTSAKISSTNLGFYGASPVAKQTVSGARDNPEEALKNLLAKLATLGLIVDDTTET